MRNRSEEVLQILNSEIQFLLSRIDELDQKLLNEVAKGTEAENNLIVEGYHLSGIYSCFEDIFSKIARIFENRIETPASWHRDLLRRMIIDVEGIRPRVISKESFLLLDELRGFRHVFRSSYMFELDPERLHLLLSKWNRGKKHVVQDIRAFCNSLQK
jgi:uncharacterized protein YutE (UPF0331/DUF86 family)